MSEKVKTFELSEVSRISGVSQDDITDFFLIKKYIKKESYGYSATGCGVDSKNVVNDKNHNALITMDGICKIASAWAAIEEGKQLIEKYGLCVNN